MKIKKILFILALISIISIVNVTYSKYLISKELELSVSAGEYFFNVKSNSDKVTKTKNSLIITAENFLNDDISIKDIEYNIEIDNPKFEVKTEEGTLNKVLKAEANTKQTDTYKLIFSEKNDEDIEEEEIINIIFNITSPYKDKREISIKFSNKQPQLIITPKNDPIRVSKGNANYLNVINNATTVRDDEGNTVTDSNLTYEIGAGFDVNTVGYYEVTYQASKEGYKSDTKTMRLIVSEPPDLDFIEPREYKAINSTITANAYSIIHLRSNHIDPQLSIEFSDLEYFSPQEYRYIAVRYKCLHNYPDLMGVFTASQPINNDYFAMVNNIRTDGVWTEVIIDLWTNPNIKNQEWIDGGIRFDFTNNENVDMDVDYIKFLKNPEDMDYVYFEDFSTPSTFTRYNYTNLNVASCSNSILSLQAATDDPQMFIQLPEDQYFDQKKYKFLYIKYSINTPSDNMELFAVPIPDSQVYSMNTNISGGGLDQYHTVVFDLSSNRDVWNLEHMIGWRIDPVRVMGTTINIDYIAVSDRYYIK